MSAKKRADLLMVECGLAENRSQAQRYIMAGLVYADGKRLDKAGEFLPENSFLYLKDTNRPYVSRGGSKLKAALEHFKIDLEKKIVLDIGASTGGFTDCALEYGAQKVIAIDVGYGQMHQRVAKDPRVIILDRTNIRYLKSLPDMPAVPPLAEKPDLALIDVSFISLKLVLPAVVNLLNKKALVLSLIKPQFEAGAENIGAGGIVTEPKVIFKQIRNVIRYYRENALKPLGLKEAPQEGAQSKKNLLLHRRQKRKNREFFLLGIYN